jgi:arylsulfatase A-like enzyme
MTSNIDLAPTFEAIGGLTPPVTVEGVSLLDVWHGRKPESWQDAILIEHRRPAKGQMDDPDRQSYQAGLPPSYEAVRTENALLVRYLTGEIEYYRTDRDPYEIHNLGAQAAPATLVRAVQDLAACQGEPQCQGAAHLSS